MPFRIPPVVMLHNFHGLWPSFELREMNKGKNVLPLAGMLNLCSERPGAFGTFLTHGELIRSLTNTLASEEPDKARATAARVVQREQTYVPVHFELGDTLPRTRSSTHGEPSTPPDRARQICSCSRSARPRASAARRLSRFLRGTP